MIANAAQVYQRALQKLADIESRCAVADAYCMRLVLANSRSGQANMLTELLPLGTPFESLYTQAGLEAIFAPFMQDISLIAGSAPTVDPEPQDENSALLTTLPIALSAIRDILGGIGQAVMGYSEIDTVMADTAGLSDNVATLIRTIGWQFAWPICTGSFRVTDDIGSLSAAATSGSGSVVISANGGAAVLGASGMSDWDKPRQYDRFLVGDLSALTVFATIPSTVVASAVDGSFEDITIGMGTLASDDETATWIPSDPYAESLGTIYLRKISTP